MPSVLTQTIPTAASAESLVPQRQALGREQQLVNTPAQAILTSQLSAQQSTVVAKADKDRAPQVPKRTEGGFAGQEENERSPGGKKSSESEGFKRPGSINVVA